jgi:hypothetical protein
MHPLTGGAQAAHDGQVGHLLEEYHGADQTAEDHVEDHVTVRGFQALQESYAKMRDQYDERVLSLEGKYRSQLCLHVSRVLCASFLVLSVFCA